MNNPEDQTLNIQRSTTRDRRSGHWLRGSARILSLCALALLCSCAGTKIKQTWKSPGYDGGAVGEVAVLGVVDRGLLRQGIENRFVRQLGEGQQPALTTFDLFTLPEAKENKDAAAERLRAAGAEAVLIVRLADSALDYREMRVGPERYAGVTTGFESWGWYDYYTMAFVDLSTTYTSTKEKVYVDVSLFDLKTEKRLWSAITKSVLDYDTDGLAELDALVGIVVTRMRADGLVR